MPNQVISSSEREAMFRANLTLEAWSFQKYGKFRWAAFSASFLLRVISLPAMSIARKNPGNASVAILSVCVVSLAGMKGVVGYIPPNEFSASKTTIEVVRDEVSAIGHAIKSLPDPLPESQSDVLLIWWYFTLAAVIYGIIRKRFVLDAYSENELSRGQSRLLWFMYPDLNGTGISRGRGKDSSFFKKLSPLGIHSIDACMYVLMGLMIFRHVDTIAGTVLISSAVAMAVDDTIFHKYEAIRTRHLHAARAAGSI